MKKIILIFSLGICTHFIYAQQFDSLTDTTKLWSIVDDYNVFMSGYTEAPSNSYFIKFSGDTVIGNLTYKKILKSTDSLQSTWTTIGYSREDTAGKVYFRNLSGDEALAYDFGLEKGDTITIWNTLTLSSWSPFQAIVDTTYTGLFAGMNRKTLLVSSIDSNYSSETWREGIGCMEGIDRYGWKSSGLTGWSYRLLCFFKNDSIYYHLSTYPGCYYPVSTQIQSEIFNRNQIYTYPNPANENLIISVNNLQLTINNVSILDITGNQVKSIKTKGQSKKYIVNVENLPAGIYFVKVQTNKGRVIKKFVKQ